MSFIGFLYKGERPKSDIEKELEKDKDFLAQRLATLETTLASLQPHRTSTALAWPIDRPPEATRAPVGEVVVQTASLETVKAKGQFKIAITLAYAMTIFGGIDLIGVIVLIVIGREVPDFMQLFFSGIVGYFGGALNAYMGVK